MSDRGSPEDRAPARPRATPALGLAAILAATLLGLVALGFAHTRHDFFLADDFNAAYCASRASTWSEAIDLRGDFRTRLIREAIPDFAADAALVRPLPSLTFWFDWQRSGRDPSGYHHTALALHGANVLLTAALAFALARSRAAAVLAGAVFAVHPAHPEAVVWLAARSDPLVTLFMLGALLLWLRYLRTGHRAALAGSCLGFVAALASKEMAAALPLVALPLTLAVDAPGRWRRAATATLALGGVLACYLALRVGYVGSLSSYHTPAGGALGAIVNAWTFVCDAALAMLWPGDRLATPGFALPRVLFAVACLALVALALPCWRRVRAPTLTCLVAALLSTAPVAPWAGVHADGQGTRLLYPTIALVAAALGSMAGAAFERARWLATAAALALVGACLGGLWQSLAPWQRAADTMRTMTHTLAERARDKRALVLCNDMPARDGPAYLAQNAFPACAWLFVRPALHIDWLFRPQWDTAVVEHAGQLAAQPDVAALRWDATTRTWVGPDGK